MNPRVLLEFATRHHTLNLGGDATEEDEEDGLIGDSDTKTSDDDDQVSSSNDPSAAGNTQKSKRYRESGDSFDST